MDYQVLKNEIGALIRELIAAQGFVLVDLVFRQDGPGLLMSLLADRPQGGISLEECSLLNRLVRRSLDEKNILSGRYSLEVSSPGLDRPLKTKEDFIRCLNKEAVFFLNDLINGKCEWKGIVSRVDETAVFIGQAGGILEIPLIKINKAKLVI
ncbi:MAG: ribosome maturation factor RimP [Candidatus Omnitrophica bacterium]|nr:ribosome maturation factor RimP [Candidatus Omnitrophota bacterium]